MRKLGILLCCIIGFFCLTGCNRTFDNTAVESFGMKFTSQIEMIEKCLSIDLEGMPDSSIKTIYSQTYPEGNELTIKYICLEGAGDFVTPNLAKSYDWSVLPYDEVIENLLLANGVFQEYDFEGIEEGYYIISGVSENSSGFDFDRNNFGLWHSYEIGIWDTYDETLYYISITEQQKCD